ncbi:hypothetical protein SI65_04536 [Aspergillus cristatus]|uniref:Protein kinase domain-containing protein n=1 Tax=Aspergillus cristatus TaxID=573508 RepID=A0A1E3BF10_ASPCR|nr:hypothetical protein SI65_04536 [Aspergillus cristatus]
MPWAFDLSNKQGLIDDQPIRIEKQLTEVADLKYGQRHVLALAHNMDTGDEIILKIRYDLNP